jgi:GGDEF domain-containing protein
MSITPGATRRLILIGGLAVLGALAAVLYLRRVDTVEVLAVLLFVPVFLGFVFAKLPGGVVTGVVASIAYAALRLNAIDAVGAARFNGLIGTRALGYITFGLLGGWAITELERSLDKLDLYDHIDDETGLYNARFFLQESDLEMARAERYRTMFSVAVVDLPASALEGLTRRKRAAVLQDVGRALRDAVRSMDRAVHARLPQRHVFAVICPETGEDGADVFITRLAASLVGFLAARGVTVTTGAADDGLKPRHLTFPGDEEPMATLRSEFALVEQTEHPDHAEGPARHTTGRPPVTRG